MKFHKKYIWIHVIHTSCMYVCMIHAHIHTYMHAYYISIHTFMYTCIYACIHERMTFDDRRAAASSIICRRTADAILVCLIILLHFSYLAWFRYKWLPQCKIEVGISRQQFVSTVNLRMEQFDFKGTNFLKVLIVQKVKIFDLLISTFQVPNLWEH